jgi:hypothetical protein
LRTRSDAEHLLLAGSSSTSPNLRRTSPATSPSDRRRSTRRDGQRLRGHRALRELCVSTAQRAGRDLRRRARRAVRFERRVRIFALRGRAAHARADGTGAVAVSGATKLVELIAGGLIPGPSLAKGTVPDRSPTGRRGLGRAPVRFRSPLRRESGCERLQRGRARVRRSKRRVERFEACGVVPFGHGSQALLRWCALRAGRAHRAEPLARPVVCRPLQDAKT